MNFGKGVSLIKRKTNKFNKKQSLVLLASILAIIYILSALLHSAFVSRDFVYNLENIPNGTYVGTGFTDVTGDVYVKVTIKNKRITKIVIEDEYFAEKYAAKSALKKIINRQSGTRLEEKLLVALAPASYETGVINTYYNGTENKYTVQAVYYAVDNALENALHSS